MPIYVYKCAPCGQQVEVLQPMGASERDCGVCDSPMVKQVTSHGLVFMGGSPAFRRHYLGTAPHTTRDTSPKSDEYGRKTGWRGSTNPAALSQGKAWLESL